MDARTRLLLDAPIVPTILRMALPNVAVMLVQASIGLIETYFVAKLGLDALAGMALVFPVLMLLQMVSAGAMGGGILSAIARSLGSGQRRKANDLVWTAIVITVLLGAIATVLALLFAPALYAAMGGAGGALAAAALYSGIVFSAAIPLWLFNSLASIIRGTGNMVFPAAVIIAGAGFLIPVSPMLIFGVGPLPRLGVAGGATAIVLYYIVGTLVFAWYIWSGRTALKPSATPSGIRWPLAREILRVGLASSIVSLSTNISIGVATGLAGLVGPATIAGYGTGVRLEYMLVPLIFGLGTPVAALVGTCVGAGLNDRARRIAWIGAAIGGGLAEAIGLAAALFPAGWLSLFSQEPEMTAYGASYLQIVGPVYGFFGAGLSLYFACQGAGRVGGAMGFAIVRVVVAVGGGWLALNLHGGSAGLFMALAFSLVMYGIGNIAVVAAGDWFRQATPKDIRLLIAE
ncbi:MAG: MATE family efflux transporter [Ancalomicrobiaceae bacterium]|nr:MATE family efflux transporter [Ancalomicrobiaceae bacterium]